MLLKHLPDMRSLAGKIVTVLSPFVWGLVIAYLLSPVMKNIGRWLSRLQAKIFPKQQKKLRPGRGKAVRVAAIALSEVFLLILLTAFASLILPQLYTSIETIVTNSPAYLTKITTWTAGKLKDYPELESMTANMLSKFNTSLVELIRNQVLPYVGNIVTSVTTGVFAAMKWIYNLIIGIFVSVYVLSNQDAALAGSRKVLYSVFPVKTADAIRKGLIFIDKTFMGFVSGKLLDSAIIGVLCYLVCALINMPYALLVSVIVGVTNIIPFFGPFIGAIPSAFIILLVDPIKCLIFIVFIFILQQIDGNIVGPKILGNSVGINGFWVMFSIILGGGLFGFLGMLLGVPVFFVIYTGLQILVNRKLKKSGLPEDTADYRDTDQLKKITALAEKAAEERNRVDASGDADKTAAAAATSASGVPTGRKK